MILRKVTLPESISGELFLSYMPGRHELFSKAQETIRNSQVSSVICLNPLEEISLKSPEYAIAINLNRLDFDWEHYPLYDLGIPEDKLKYVLFVKTVVNRLRGGKKILIHCAGGIGRTATLAISILLAFGIEISEAQSVVREAGSMVQSKAQKELIVWLYENIYRE